MTDLNTIFDGMIAALNMISVRGEEDMVRLLGTIQNLKTLKGMIKTRTCEMEVTEDDAENEQRKDV